MNHRMQLKHLLFAHEDYGRLNSTPGIMDMAYSIFCWSKEPNPDDGGPSDWFNDTRPKIEKEVKRLQGMYDSREECEPDAIDIVEAARVLQRAGIDRLRGMTGDDTLDFNSVEKLSRLQANKSGY